MRAPTIARNYAEALFELGERSGDTERYADLIEAVAGAVESDNRIKLVLESPRVSKTRKGELLAAALAGRAPEQFIRFLHAVVRRGRQGVLSAVAHAYMALVDVKFNRVHASVVTAREPDQSLRNEITKRLSAILSKEVLAHFRTDRAILGGVIIRVGDRVMDGSLRRKMVRLRRSMLG